MTKILIIDDDPLIIQTNQQAFKSTGYEVEVASDGKMGLEKVASFIPDIILMDVMMPVLSGIEVLRELKSDPVTKNIPVIISSNLGSSEDAETVLGLGAVKYIAKNEYKPQDLIKLFESTLSTHNK